MWVLLLNASYEPLQLCSWRRAIRLMYKGKAIEVESTSEKTLGHGYTLPLVIRLLHYVKLPYKPVALTRRNLLHRDNHQCQYCGSTQLLTMDHIMPRSRGGAETWHNMTTACRACNVKKGNRTPEEARMPLRNPPYTPQHCFTFELGKHLGNNPKLLSSWSPYLFVSPKPGKSA